MATAGAEFMALETTEEAGTCLAFRSMLGLVGSSAGEGWEVVGGLRAGWDRKAYAGSPWPLWQAAGLHPQQSQKPPLHPDPRTATLTPTAPGPPHPAPALGTPRWDQAPHGALPAVGHSLNCPSWSRANRDELPDSPMKGMDARESSGAAKGATRRPDRSAAGLSPLLLAAGGSQMSVSFTPSGNTKFICRRGGGTLRPVGGF